MGYGSRRITKVPLLTLRQRMKGLRLVMDPYLGSLILVNLHWLVTSTLHYFFTQLWVPCTQTKITDCIILFCNRIMHLVIGSKMSRLGLKNHLDISDEWWKEVTTFARHEPNQYLWNMMKRRVCTPNPAHTKISGRCRQLSWWYGLKL